MPEPLTIYVCPDERCAKVSTIPTSCAGELGRYHHELVARVAVRVFREEDVRPLWEAARDEIGLAGGPLADALDTFPAPGEWMTAVETEDRAA